MSANKETLSGVGTVCELGTNYPQAFVPSLSFKTTHILTLHSLLEATKMLDVDPTKAGFVNTEHEGKKKKKNQTLFGPKDLLQNDKLSLKHDNVLQRLAHAHQRQ